MSFRYQQGSTLLPIVTPDWAYKKYEWARNDDGSLKTLIQKFELHKGQDRTQLLAYFDAKTNTSYINGLGNDKTWVIAPGLILLRMRTVQGTLQIDFDVNAPATVPDIAPPVLTVPNSFTLEATSAAGAPATFNVSALDAVDGLVPVVCTAVAGSVFPLGTTTVGCSAADLSGNVAQRSFTVTVRDTTPPVLMLPAPILVQPTSAAGAV